MKSFTADIIEAVRQYKCVGSLWQYRDRVPLEVKNFIAVKHHKTLEDFDTWA